MPQPNLAITRCSQVLLAVATAVVLTAAAPCAGGQNALLPVVPQSPAPVARLPKGSLIKAADARAPFQVGDGSGALFILLRHRTPVSFEVSTPAGQGLNPKNIWRVGRWYSDDSVDVITIDAPATGAWQLSGADLAPIQVQLLPAPQARKMRPAKRAGGRSSRA